jgi:glycosyltransferase involved in cell wall biosynthesis
MERTSNATSMPASAPAVTVLIPCRNERAYIGRCLDSILAGDYPLDRLEILVVDGMSDDGTRAVLAEYVARRPLVRVVDNAKRTTPAALNLGIRAARGDVLVRVDAHLLYPRNYVSGLVAALDEFGADNVGGVLRTLPANETTTAKAIATALAAPLGVGTSHFRIGTDRPRWVDTIAFFCVRRAIFDRVGMFDEELIRNEDDEFNARLIKSGGRVLLIPDVESSYYARATLRQVGRMFYQYGYFKPLVAKKLKRFVTLRQLIPPAFVLALCAATVAAFVFDSGMMPAGLLLSAYAALVLAASIQVGARQGTRVALAFAVVLPLLHVSYGVGFWRRVLELLLLPFSRASAARPSDLPLSR